jgi:MFS family permease
MSQKKLYALYMLLQKVAINVGAVVYISRLSEEFGMTNHQIMMLQLFYFIPSLLFELPTGVLGDKIGYKSTISLGALCWFLSRFLSTISTNYSMFAIAEVMAALGSTCISGALDAWASRIFADYKSYSIFKRENNQRIRLIGIGMSLGSGVIAQYLGYQATFVVATSMLFVGFVLTLMFVDYKEITTKSTTKIVLSSLSFYKEDRTLMSMLILAFSNMLWIAPVFTLWGPVTKIDLQLNNVWLGVISVSITIGIYAGGWVEGKIKNRLTNINPFVSEVMWQVLKGLTIVLLALSIKGGPYSFFVCMIAFEAMHTVNDQFSELNAKRFWMNNPNEATIASIYSFGARLGGGLGSLTLGYLADVYGRSNSFMICGIAMIVVSLIIFVTTPHSQVKVTQ